MSTPYKLVQAVHEQVDKVTKLLFLTPCKSHIVHQFYRRFTVRWLVSSLHIRTRGRVWMVWGRLPRDRATRAFARALSVTPVELMIFRSTNIHFAALTETLVLARGDVQWAFDLPNKITSLCLSLCLLPPCRLVCVIQGPLLQATRLSSRRAYIKPLQSFHVPTSSHTLTSHVHSSSARSREISSLRAISSISTQPISTQWLMITVYNHRKPFYYTPLVQAIRSIKWR